MLAGIDARYYVESPSWQRSYLDAVASRVLEHRGAMKRDEVQAFGVVVGQTLGKLFKK